MGKTDTFSSFNRTAHGSERKHSSNLNINVPKSKSALNKYVDKEILMTEDDQEEIKKGKEPV